MNAFRWRSWLGASVILFLLWGAGNVVPALLVPGTLIRGGAGAGPLVFDQDLDAYLAGGRQVLEGLRSTNPKLDTLLVSSMVNMCSQMMAFGILTILIAWFVVRRGNKWGIWGVAAASLAEVPYAAIITSMYAAQGAPVGYATILAWVAFFITPLLALAAGIVGTRRSPAHALPG